MAVLDAMAAMSAVREFDRVGKANARLKPGDKPTGPGFDADMAAWVQEVVVLGKRRAWIEANDGDGGSS